MNNRVNIYKNIEKNNTLKSNYLFNLKNIVFILFYFLLKYNIIKKKILESIINAKNKSNYIIVFLFFEFQIKNLKFFVCFLINI
jgi:hypothetical protein